MKPQAKQEGDASTELPEPLIHHIQSFLTGKEAAETSCLSKSWYAAWLTRPNLDFDQLDLKKGADFAGIWTKTMERYRDMNLRIESFSLRSRSCAEEIGSLAKKLITDAIEIGATDLNIEVSSYPSKFVLPPEVLGSKTLTRLRLSECRIAEGNVMIRCSKLKSLVLDLAYLGSDDNILWDIISRCTSSIEELSFSAVQSDHKFNKLNLFVLHKLRCLDLSSVNVGDSFFSDIASRFPCLKDLSICRCTGYTRIQIASTSLESISFEVCEAIEAEFDVPNIRKFVYVGSGAGSGPGSGLPSLCFTACSREWESDISLEYRRPLNSELLQRLLNKLRESTISLCITSEDWEASYMAWDYGDDAIVDEPVEVEHLTIDKGFIRNPSPAIVGLFRVCRPAFIYFRLHGSLYIHKTIECILTNLNLSTQFDLNAELYEDIPGEWRSYELTYPDQ